jgi:Ca2+-binding EF-hand superfamily protein
LSEKELEKLFIDAQIPLHAQTLSHIFRQLVKKKGNGVSFANIMEIITLPSASLDEAEDYVNIFQMYDRNNRGYFDFEDYRYVCQGIAKDLSEDEIH